tara:strand:+ start:492 stop:830 length:339 start_codon:yes stop_codon:yes gene_type:complete
MSFWSKDDMIVTTTNSIEGRSIAEYKGIVVGETIMGANVFRDFLAGVTDVIGGRSGAYESKMNEARETALAEMQNHARQMGANAIVGVDLDYEVVREGMLMVSASGTAVVLS